MSLRQRVERLKAIVAERLATTEGAADCATCGFPLRAASHWDIDAGELGLCECGRWTTPRGRPLTDSAMLTSNGLSTPAPRPLRPDDLAALDRIARKRHLGTYAGES